MAVCEKCGKKTYFSAVWKNTKVHAELVGKNLCNDCWKIVNNSVQQETGSRFEEPFSQADNDGKRMVTVTDVVFSEDGVGKHLKLHVESAEKYGYSFVSLNQGNGQNMLKLINMVMVFEKKEIKPARFVECPHCTARFDANLYFKCPNCGAL